jgi:hypothetical protein
LTFDAFALPAVILLAVAATILLASYDWRLSLSALGAMYVGVFVLVALAWPLEMAVAKLVAGWIAASVLGMSLINRPMRSPRPRYRFSEIVFRVAAAGLMGLVAVSLTPGMIATLGGVTFEQALGGLLLLGLGILHLGFTADPLRVVIGLLTVFAGFEILYAAGESSVLVAGFLAVINMGLALTGAYLLLSPAAEAEE